MNLIGWLVYVPLQILWLPLSIVGALWVAYKQIVVSSRMGVSQTAVEIINGRWTLDVFGMRPDPPSRNLASTIPNNSTVGLGLALFPLWLTHKIIGRPFFYPKLPPPEEAGIANLVPSRSVVFDQLIATNTDEAEQLVVLGAGLDTRAYGTLKQQGLAMFELDQKSMQAYKREYVTKAQLDLTDVNYVEVDFGNADWISALRSSSYDASQRTIFLWEGVTLYLSENDVRETLAAVKANASTGSVVVADFYSATFVKKLGKGKATSKILDATGEGLELGLDFSSDAESVFRRFVEEQHYTLGRHQFLGSKRKDGPFAVIAELVI